MKTHLASKYYKYSTFETVQGFYIRVYIDRILVEHSIKEYLDERAQESADNNEGAFPDIVFKSKDKYLVFDILLDSNYPFNQPQIFCRSAFSSPPLNDGRDIFSEVLKSDWHVTKKLHEIIMYIPEFVADIAIEESENGSGMLLKVMGTFHLGNNYEMSNWGASGINRESRIFRVEEQDEADEDTFYPRQLVITPSALLILESVKGFKNVGTLLSWATLQSLDKIRRNLSRPDLVTFVWRHIDGKQPWVLNLMIPDEKHEECIQIIVANMKNMGVGVEKNTKNEKKLQESEVTKEAIARMDVETILEHIAAYEAALSTDLSLSTVQTLTTLYQKAIEYYSAFDDLLYNDFLNRMQSLLQREDIQTIFSSYDEDQRSRLSSSQTTQSNSLTQQQKPSPKPQVDFNVSSEEEEEEEEEYDEEEEEEQEQDEEENHGLSDTPPQAHSQKELSVEESAVNEKIEEANKTFSSLESQIQSKPLESEAEEVKEVSVQNDLEDKQEKQHQKEHETEPEAQTSESHQIEVESEKPSVEEGMKVEEKVEESSVIVEQSEIQEKQKVESKGEKENSNEEEEDDQEIDDYLDKIEQD